MANWFSSIFRNKDAPSIFKSFTLRLYCQNLFFSLEFTLQVVVNIVCSCTLQDVGESLDPSLNPILSKNTIQRGNHSVILIGETEIEYNSNFRLYMTTPLANPHFLPEVCIKVTVINFTVTVDGLQDQLLSRVVQKERPKLEESRRELLQGLVNDRYKLRELEDRSLSLLHSSRGNNTIYHHFKCRDLTDRKNKNE